MRYVVVSVFNTSHLVHFQHLLHIVLVLVQNIIKECYICKRYVDLTLKEGDDFVVFKPCTCFACPKCLFKLCSNRKSNTPVCPKDGCREEMCQAIYFEFSRNGEKDRHTIKVEKFHTDIKKGPGKFFKIQKA